MSYLHRCDADCAGHIVGDTCMVCGVSHTGECPECGGNGFHAALCPDNDERYTLCVNAVHGGRA
jgi:hypothetical protein